MPILFVDGKEDAVAKTREKVPDALYVSAGAHPGTLARFARADA